MTAVPAPEGPAYRPDQLLSARHDTPDQTGAVTDWEPVTEDAPAPEAATPPMALAGELEERAAAAREEADNASQRGNVITLNYAAGNSDANVAAAELVRELAPQWDALAARLAEADAALESISAAREMRSDGELTDEGFATVVYDALDVLRAQEAC